LGFLANPISLDHRQLGSLALSSFEHQVASAAPETVNTALGSLHICAGAEWYMLMLVDACKDVIQTMNLRHQNARQTFALTRKSSLSDLMLAHASSNLAHPFHLHVGQRVVTVVSRADRQTSFRSPSSQTATTPVVGRFFMI
jgi:hypothetical protein